MNTEELLQFTSRDKLRDFALPRLWSDEFLLQLLNDGQRQFARRTHVLLDDSSRFTELVTVDGVAAYTLDKRIIFVQHVFNAEGIELLPQNRSKRPGSLGEGAPSRYWLDSGSRKIRLFPVPDDEYLLYLTVARRPLCDLTLNNLDAEPEIPEDYHMALADYAAFHALRNNNAEGSEMSARADEFLRGWEQAVRECKQEVYQRRSGPNPRAVRSATFNRRLR